MPKAGELTVALTESPADLDLSLRVWTPNVQHLTGWMGPLAKGGDSIHKIDVNSPGRYRLEVRDGKNDGRSADHYRLTTSFVPTADPSEPNGSIAGASPAILGEALQANILPKGDADYYAIDVPQQGEMTLAITDMPENLDIAMRVWTPGLKHLTGWMRPLAKGGDNVQQVDIQFPGRYLVEVRDGNNDGRSQEPYTFTPTLTASNDLMEPNGSIRSAAPINLGDSIEAALIPKGEVDWYRVEVERAGVLRTVIDNSPPELNMSVRLWNADLKHASGWVSAPALGAVLDMPVKIREGGTYFLEVRDGNNDARSAKPYRLTTSWEPPAE